MKNHQKNHIFYGGTSTVLIIAINLTQPLSLKENAFRVQTKHFVDNFYLWLYFSSTQFFSIYLSIYIKLNPPKKEMSCFFPPVNLLTCKYIDQA